MLLVNNCIDFEKGSFSFNNEKDSVSFNHEESNIFRDE